MGLNENAKGQINALLAQVSINKNQPHDALKLAELALEQLDASMYRSRIVATSVVGEVNHVLGYLSRALPLMQQTEKLARQHQVFHQALWALLQQSEILIAQGFIQSAYDVQDTAFKLIDVQHLHQLPLHEFLLRLRAQVLWCWNRFDEAEEYTYKALDVLGHLDSSKHLHCYSMLARISIARGERDNSGRFIEQIQQRLSQSDYHLDWTANASLSLILYWNTTQNTSQLLTWISDAVQPENARNHFSQLQWRNIARAHIYTENYPEAEKILQFLNAEAQECELVADQNRNLILQTALATKVGQNETAQEQLIKAINLSNQTGMVGYFYVDSDIISEPLEKLIARNRLGEIEKHRARDLLKSLSIKQKSRSAHFNPTFVRELIALPTLPELIRASPLTQREWQVLGLIYSGFSNDQIAHELSVATTTIKTHIRNLYQKLNIANRNEAIETAQDLLNLMGH